MLPCSCGKGMIGDIFQWALANRYVEKMWITCHKKKNKLSIDTQYIALYNHLTYKIWWT